MDDKRKRILIWVLTVLISFSAGYVIAYPTEPAQLDAPTITSTHNDIWGITIEWDAVYDADGYKVYRGQKPDLYTKIGETSETSFYDNTAKIDTIYFYRIRAISNNEKTQNSEISNFYSSKISTEASKGFLKDETYEDSTYEDDYSEDYIEETVYITDTGTKYHKYGCQYLSQSCIEISLDNALAEGYTACSKCW